MTKNQLMFANEYLVDFNGTRAYKAAYKNIKNDETAAVNASRLLRSAKVKAYIDEKIKEITDEKIADAVEVMKYLTSIMRGEEKEETLIGLGQGEQKITEIDVSSKERLRAAELLGKRYAIFIDKKEIDATVQSDKLDSIIEQLRE